LISQGHTLQKHNEYCYVIQLFRFVDCNTFVSAGEIKTLQNFIQDQKDIQQNMADELKRYSRMMFDNILQGFEKVLAELKQKQLLSDEKPQKLEPSDKSKLTG